MKETKEKGKKQNVQMRKMIREKIIHMNTW